MPSNGALEYRCVTDEIAETHELSPTLSISHLCIPFPGRKNPHAALAAQRAKMRAHSVGLLSDSRLVQTFDDHNTICAYCYPLADLDQLVACYNWCNWLFFFDDEFDNHLEHARDLKRLERLIQGYVQLFRTGQTFLEPTPFVEFTRLLRQDLFHLSDDRWLQRFSHSVAQYGTLGFLPATRHWGTGSVPAVDEYLLQREHDSAMYPVIDLIEVAGQAFIPDEVLSYPLLQRMRRLCTRVVAYVNDMMSYQKEVSKYGNLNNLLHVLMIHRNMSFAEAIDWTVRLVNQDVDHFIELKQALIAQNHSWLNDSILVYLEGMEDWMRGNLDWSFTTQRYCAPDAPFPELRFSSNR